MDREWVLSDGPEGSSSGLKHRKNAVAGGKIIGDAPMKDRVWFQKKLFEPQKTVVVTMKCKYIYVYIYNMYLNHSKWRFVQLKWKFKLILLKLR